MCKRAVVVGRGCITRYATNIQEYISQWENYQSCKLDFSTYYKNKSVKYTDKDILEKLPRLSVTCKALMLSVAQAVSEADFMLRNIDKERIGVIVATQDGVLESQVRYLKLYEKTKATSNILFQHTANNLVTGLISLKYGYKGYSSVICNGVSSGWDALMMGEYLIKKDILDGVIIAACDGVKPYGMETERSDKLQNQAVAMVLMNQLKIQELKKSSLGSINIHSAYGIHPAQANPNSEQTYLEDVGDYIYWNQKQGETYSANMFRKKDFGKKQIELGNFMNQNGCSAALQCVFLGLLEPMSKNTIVVNYESDLQLKIEIRTQEREIKDDKI